MKIENINMKNSKAEMIEKYNKLVEEYKAISTTNIDVKKIEKDQRETEIIKAADEIVDMNILNNEIIKKYNDLNEAIKIKEDKIKELFDLEVEAHSLIALINAHNEKKVELEEDYAKKVKELEDAVVEKKEIQKKEFVKIELEKKEFLSELETKNKARKEEIEKERKRDEEEYSYATARKRKEEDDNYSDDKIAREKILSEKEEEFKKRSEELEKKEKEFEELKEKVEDIPNKIEEAKKEGAEAKEKELGKEYGYKKHMYEKEKELEIKSLTNKIEMIERELEKALNEKEELTRKLDNSYLEIKELATETVKSTGGVKIIGNPNSNDSKK